MSSRSLGTLTLDLVLKAGGFTAGLDKAARDTDKRMTEIERRAYKFGETLGKGLKIGASVAVVALGALSIAIGKAIDNADEMRDLSIRLGTSTETLSAFGYAASQTGTDLDTLGRGMKILAKNAADALKPTSEQAQIFDALGISVTDVTGKLKDQSVLIPEIADAFKGMEDGTTKTALALALFGKSGTDMIEFLNQGSDGLQDFEDKARSLGIIIDSETAAAADEFNDILGELRAIVSGGALTIAKELLPALKEGATDLKRLANNGQLASNIAAVLSATLSAGVNVFDVYNRAVARASIQLEGYIGIAEGWRDIQRSTFTDSTIVGGMKKISDAAEKESKALAELEARYANRKRFDDVSISFDTTETASSNVDRGKLSNALAGIGGGGSKRAGRSGKSEAEKEADKLKAAYDRMNESLTEHIGLFNVKGEVAKVVYEFEHGVLSTLTDIEAKRLGIDKEALIAKAEKLELLGKEKEAEDALVKKREEQDRNFNNVNDAINEQILLIGMSADEMEIYNNLTAAGVTAESARGQEIIENTRLLQSMSEAMSDQIELMDTIRTEGANFLSDWIGGTKSFKESLLDAFESIHQKILQMIAENLMDQLFGKQGDPAGGSSGDFFSSILGAFFGGGNASGSGAGDSGTLADLFGGAWGFANGGKTKPWSISEVNERGFEMASVKGKDYLMTGSQSVQITPNHKLGGGRGGAPITQIFQNPVFSDQKRESQRLQESGRKLQLATRNS